MGGCLAVFVIKMTAVGKVASAFTAQLGRLKVHTLESAAAENRCHIMYPAPFLKAFTERVRRAHGDGEGQQEEGTEKKAHQGTSHDTR